MTLLIIVSVLMLLAVLWTVMARSLIRSMLGLALVSIGVTMTMFLFAAPLAGVFELSVCAGLITVIFAATVSLTKPVPRADRARYSRERLKRYWPVPVLMLLASAACLYFLKVPDFATLPALAAGENSVRHILWHGRTLDLLGQVLLILLGAFGVITLFKEIKNQ
jgi:NADH-quinone oxidoreductase subunit J